MTKKDTDTVPAMLTPGEAVLTVAAAERLGRKKIAMLNKTSGKKARKYADGTENVAPMDKLTDPDGEQTFLRKGMTLDEARSTGKSIGAALAKRAIQRGNDAYNAETQSGPHYSKGTAKVAKSKPKASAAKPRKYDEGTSKVIKDDYSKEDFADDAQYESNKNDYKDPTQNKNQGPTPLNLSNMQYAQKHGEKTIWNGPTGKRDTPSYSKGTAKVPQPRMSKVDRVVDRLFKK